jgi:2-phosphoglycerate kinase
MLFRNKFNASRIDAMKHNPQLVIDDQNEESRIVWSYSKTFIASNLEDGMEVGIEGVAVLPELLSKADFPFRVVYLINFENQTDSILNHARTNQSDWLHTYDDETIRAFCSFNQLLNRYYFEEATKYGYPLIEVHSDSFNEDINGAVSILLHS